MERNMTAIDVTDAMQMQHLANQVHDHATVLQAMQADMHHLVKNVDKLVLVAEKQAELSGELTRHSDSIERAFKDIAGIDSKLAKAVDAMTNVFAKDKEKSDDIASTVTGYKASLRTVTLIGGTIVSLLGIIGFMYSDNVSREQDRINARIQEISDKFERRVLAVDLKLDTQSQQVQEVRLDRQRDLEAKGNRK